MNSVRFLFIRLTWNWAISRPNKISNARNQMDTLFINKKPSSSWLGTFFLSICVDWIGKKMLLSPRVRSRVCFLPNVRSMSWHIKYKSWRGRKSITNYQVEIYRFRGNRRQNFATCYQCIILFLLPLHLSYAILNIARQFNARMESQFIAHFRTK